MAATKPPQATPVRDFLNKLVGRKSKTDNSPYLPKKLASVPFTSSLLASPLPLDEIFKRRLQLERVISITVQDFIPDKKNALVYSNKLEARLKLTLKPQETHELTSIFVPNTTSEVHEKIQNFQQVRQLDKLLAFCVRPGRVVHSLECEFCSKLGVYLKTHSADDPVVVTLYAGGTVLRKPALAMFWLS